MAPRSASSTSVRETLNSARSSTKGKTRRCAAVTPADGAEIETSRPKGVAECDQPCGPPKSTSFRAARWVASRVLAS